MDIRDFDPTYGMFRTASTIELEETNSNDLEYSVLEYIQYGTVSAITSAAVGILNTGIAFGDMLGLADEDDYIDEENAVTGIFGEATGDFYRQHKTGVDAIGLVAGSFIPGMAAIKALRLAQTAGKIPVAAQVTSGLRNPDLILGSKALKNAKDSVMSSGVKGIRNTEVRKAYAAGLGQQFLESAAFDFAVVATMNQNATLNPDDLDYFSAAKNVLFDSAPFIFVGGAIGGGLEALRINGAIKTFVKGETARVADFQVPDIPALTGLTPGDKFVLISKAAESHKRLATSIEDGDSVAKRAYEVGQNTIKQMIRDVAEEAGVKEASALELIEQLTERASSGELEQISGILSGLTKIDKITNTDLEDLTKFYDRQRGVTAVIRADNSKDIAESLMQRQGEFRELLKSKGLDDLAENMYPREFAIGMAAQINTRTTAGFALPGGKLAPASDRYDTPLRLSLGKASENDKVGVFVPDYISVNDTTTEAIWQINKDWHLLNNSTFDMDLDQFKNYVFLHELGHVRSNTGKFIRLIQNQMYSGNNSDIIKDLLTVSVRSRKKDWAMSSGFTKEEDIIKSITDWLEDPDWFNPPQWLGYLGKPEELLADGAAYFVREETRQIAAKQFPKLGKLFDRRGAIAKMWDDSKAFINVRTGKSYSSVLPGIQDVSRNAKLLNKDGKLSLVVPEINKTFNRDPALFSNVLQKVIDGKIDVMEFDAQWNIVDRLSLQDIVDMRNAEGIINVDPNDLPLMEKIYQLGKTDPRLENKVSIGGKITLVEDLGKMVSERKQQIRDELMLAPQVPNFNEEKISKILNTSKEFAMGQNTADSLLYGVKDFTKPEYLRTQYKHRTPESYQNAAISLNATMMREQLVAEQRERVAAELLGNDYKLFAELEPPEDAMKKIHVMDSRSTLFTTARPDFGSLREFAAFVGKQVNKMKSKLIREIDEDYVHDTDTFNRANSYGLRQELAQIDNLARRRWYYRANMLDEDGNLVHYMVDKHALQRALAEYSKDIGEQIEFDPAMLEELPSEIAEYLNRGTRSSDPEIFSISEEVANFADNHIRRNRDIVAKKRSLASVYGREAVYDENVFYPPPRDLKTQKFHAFIVPSEAMRGSDPRKYMVFAETEAEFNAKVALIQEKYGNKYKLVTPREDVPQYKRLLGEYDRDLVFDDLFFDADIARMGKTSELFPNLDIHSSSTLDRYRQWTIRQHEALISSGVELKYGKLVQQLKALDFQYGKVGRTALEKRYRGPDTIWKDTLSLMQDRKSYGGAAEDLFVRINDFVGEYGSRIMDGAISILRPSKYASGITDEAMAQYNKQLHDAGIVAPTRNAIEAIITSPQTEKSRTLPNLVRTLSNLTSTFMLRMDTAHSIIQGISTPILGLPVLQELQQSLRGTARGKQLADLVSVVQPTTGMREPTAAKLLAQSAKDFFTEDGKAFMQELRDRNIITDYLIQYLDTLDFATFNGAHTLQQVSDKIDKLATFGSKWSGFTFSEEFTRFIIANSARKIGELGGLKPSEMWPMISSSVDKVHGIYIGTQRPQAFQGVVGQAMGLYQTYFFNFMQNMMKFYSDGQRKQLITLSAMQTSIFGAQSWTGFQALNQMIGETNRNNLDLYSVTNADDPKSMASYFMYGLGSYALGVPIDFYSRGDLSTRHATVLPTNPFDFPVVSTLSKAIGNAVNTAKMLTDENIPVGEALLHGLAHNGMNRPMQGLGNILRNRVTTGNAQINFDNINYVDGNMAGELDWGAMFARIIGAKPLNESIIMNAYYRDVAYDANYRKELVGLGKKIQLSLSSGTVAASTYQDFAQDYERIGGEPGKFNAYWMRQVTNLSRPEMEEFKKEMDQSRAYKRILAVRSNTRPWDIPDEPVE